jgi:hypothetical protein
MNYKRATSTYEAEKSVPLILGEPGFRGLIWPSPQPRTFDLLGRDGMPGIATLEIELCWCTQALSHFAPSINAFLRSKQAAEEMFLAGKRDDLDRTLIAVSQSHGVSLWLAESYLNAIQEFDGNNAHLEYARYVRSFPRMGASARYHLSWASFRASQSVSAGEFSRVLSDTLAPADGAFALFTRMMLGEMCHITESDAAAMISYADSLPVVDRYLAFLATVQMLVASETASLQTLQIIQRYISMLANLVADPSLSMLELACGGEALHWPVRPRSLSPLDLYTGGDYLGAVDASEAVLRDRYCIDTLHLRLRALARVPDLRCHTPYFVDGPIAKIEADVWTIVQFAEEAPDAMARLRKLVLMHSKAAWSSSLGLILDRRVHDDRIFPPTPRQICYSLRSDQDNPSNAFTLHGLGAGTRYLDLVALSTNVRATCLLLKHVISPGLESISDLVLPVYRRDRLSAIYALRRGRPSEAIPLLERDTTNLPRSERIEVGLLLAEALLRAGFLHRCADCCVSLYLTSEYAGRLLPIRRLADAFVRAADGADAPDRHLFGHLATVMVFDLAARLVAPSWEAERADAFSDFLDAEGLSFPSDIAAALERYDRGKLAYFLRRVCVPEVLDQLLALRSTRQVEDERAKVIVLLSGLITEEGKPPPPDLTEELREIRTRQIVRDTTRRLDRSRIYVNVDGIKRTLALTLRDDWHRYKLIKLQQQYGQIEELQQLLQKLVGDKVRLFTLVLPLTEGDKLFRQIVAGIRELFTSSKEFGLDSNLSTNIRHGYVMRELRGPFVTRNLVTNRVSEAGGYLPNVFWAARVDDNDNNGNLAEIDNALGGFSGKVDEIIERLNRDLIRIRSDKAPNGLFQHPLSDTTLARLQHQCESTNNYEEFVDVVINVMWDLTHASLDQVRERLLSDILHQFQVALGDLQDELEQMARARALTPLLDSVNLVRPEIRAAVERVASWFVPSVNSEFADYPLQLAYDAGLATVRSYYKDLEVLSKFEGGSEVLMSGWTLPTFARLFSILIENAAFHSGISKGKLQLPGKAACEAGKLSIKLRNALSLDIDRSWIESRVQHINNTFNREGATAAIGDEGGSGYPKIFKLLAYDLGREHMLNVRVTPEVEFEVDIEIEAKDLAK